MGGGRCLAELEGELVLRLLLRAAELDERGLRLRAQRSPRLRVATLARADRDSITFVTDKRYLADLAHTPAAAVFVSAQHAGQRGPASTIGAADPTPRLARESLFAAALLSFALSIDDYIITSFVAGTETTLPMYIWSMMRRTVTPLINAISTLALALSILVLMAAWIVGRLRRAHAVSTRSDA